MVTGKGKHLEENKELAASWKGAGTPNANIHPTLDISLNGSLNLAVDKCLFEQLIYDL